MDFDTNPGLTFHSFGVQVHSLIDDYNIIFNDLSVNSLLLSSRSEHLSNADVFSVMVAPFFFTIVRVLIRDSQFVIDDRNVFGSQTCNMESIAYLYIRVQQYLST